MSNIEVQIPTNELRKAGNEFKKAGKDLAAMIEHLDEVTREIKNKWAGAPQQVFYKEYQEIHQYISGLSGILSNISKEMDSTADRMEKTDNKL